MRLSKEERTAKRRQRREQEEYRRAQRKDPWPPNVWVVTRDRRYHLLEVVGPGQLNLSDSTGEPRPYAVAAVRVGRVLGSRMTFRAADGSALRIRTVVFGEAGRADVGTRAARGDGGMGLPADDFFGPILLIPWLVVSIVMLPVRVKHAITRRRTARVIEKALLP